MRQGHRRNFFGGKIPFARALLAKIHELKEQAEGVRKLIGLLRVEPVEDGPPGLKAGLAAEMARAFGQSADGVQMVENFFAGLFGNDFVQAADQLPDLLFENFAHTQLLFDFFQKLFAAVTPEVFTRFGDGKQVHLVIFHQFPDAGL
jgi:hypothetical protein